MTTGILTFSGTIATVAAKEPVTERGANKSR
jgi:hypothetical protein